MSDPEKAVPSIMLTVRVPAAVVDGIDARAAKEGVGRSEIVRELLALGVRSEGSVEAEVAALRREIHALRKDFANLHSGRK